MDIGIIILALFAIFIFTLGFKRAFFLYFCYDFIDCGLLAIRGLQYKHILLAVFLIKALSIYTKNKDNRYPFTTCSIIFIIPYVVCNMFSSYANMTSVTSIILTVLQNIAMPFILFVFLKTSNDLKKFTRYILVLCLIMCLYAYFEISIGTSPVVDFIHNYNHDGLTSLRDSYRFGSIKSTQSFFLHATTFGYVACMFLTLLMLFVYRYNRGLRIKKANVIITIIMLASCVLFSGARSSIAGMFILFGYLILTNSTHGAKTFVRTIIIGGLIILLLNNFFADYFSQIIDSILYSDKSAIGSSTSMRTIQLAVVLSYFSQSPILGFGSGYTFGQVVIAHPEIYGAESIWFTIGIDFGLIGILSYLFSLIAIEKSFKYDKRNCTFMLLLFVFINTLTSVPGIYFSFILSIFIYIDRLNYFVYEEKSIG